MLVWEVSEAGSEVLELPGSNPISFFAMRSCSRSNSWPVDLTTYFRLRFSNFNLGQLSVVCRSPGCVQVGPYEFVGPASLDYNQPMGVEVRAAGIARLTMAWDNPPMLSVLFLTSISPTAIPSSGGPITVMGQFGTGRDTEATFAIFNQTYVGTGPVTWLSDTSFVLTVPPSTQRPFLSGRGQLTVNGHVIVAGDWQPGLQVAFVPVGMGALRCRLVAVNLRVP